MTADGVMTCPILLDAPGAVVGRTLAGVARPHPARLGGVQDLRRRGADVPDVTATWAVFGGVYNNWLALEATLDDAARRGARAAYCLGDLGGFGPHPDRVFPILQARDVGVLQGNYDHSIGHDLGRLRLRLHRSARQPLRAALVRLHARAHVAVVAAVATRAAADRARQLGRAARAHGARLAATGQRVPVGVDLARRVFWRAR